MTVENKPVITDGGNHGATEHAHEPGSDQARFMAKLREAAKSTADNIGRASQPSTKVVHAKAETSTAVQDILNGFTLEDLEKQGA